MTATTKPPAGPDKVKSKERQDRLAEALRANLRRRKEQKRGRDDAQATEATLDNPASADRQER